MVSKMSKVWALVIAAGWTLFGVGIVLMSELFLRGRGADNTAVSALTIVGTTIAAAGPGVAKWFTGDSIESVQAPTPVPAPENEQKESEDK
jgi:hypothetical protein